MCCNDGLARVEHHYTCTLELIGDTVLSSSKILSKLQRLQKFAIYKKKVLQDPVLNRHTHTAPKGVPRCREGGYRVSKSEILLRIIFGFTKV